MIIKYIIDRNEDSASIDRQTVGEHKLWSFASDEYFCLNGSLHVMLA